MLRLYCVLYKARQRNETPLAQALGLGIRHGDAEPGTPLHDALLVVFGPENRLCRCKVTGVTPWDGSAPAAAPVAAAAGAPRPHKLAQRLMAAIGVRGGGGSSADDGTQQQQQQQEQQQQQQQQPVMSLREFTDKLLYALYLTAARFADLPSTWIDPPPPPALAGVVTAALGPSAAGGGGQGPPDAAPAVPAPLPAALPPQPPRPSLRMDSSSMHVFDTQLLDRLRAPAAPSTSSSSSSRGGGAGGGSTNHLSKVAAVLDMVAVSRAGNFTCPVRVGMLYAGAATAATPSPEAWLQAAANRGELLPAAPARPAGHAGSLSGSSAMARARAAAMAPEAATVAAAHLQAELASSRAWVQQQQAQQQAQQGAGGGAGGAGRGAAAAAAAAVASGSAQVTAVQNQVAQVYLQVCPYGCLVAVGQMALHLGVTFGGIWWRGRFRL